MTDALLLVVIILLGIVALRIRQVTLAVVQQFQRVHDLTPSPILCPPGLPAVPLACGHTAEPYCQEPGFGTVCEGCHARTTR